MPGFWYALLLSATCSGMLALAAGLQMRSLNIPSNISQGTSSRPPAEPLSEETALKNYRYAAKLAEKAVAAFESANNADSSTLSLDLTLRERDLWHSALKQLATIPKSSDLHKRAIKKRAQYEPLLANAERKLTKANKDFIDDIIQSADINAASVHVTLCQIEKQTDEAKQTGSNLAASSPLLPPLLPPLLLENGKLDGDRCRHYQGDQLMASAASLIKVPIALALVYQSANSDKADSINLSQKILIDPSNFTENAAGAVIEIGEKYTLRQIMSHMISDSDNIATNQLIDYLGYDDINQALTDLGYQQTAVGHKLAGDQVMPADFGIGNNETSTNEITAMMAQVYRSTAPSDPDIVTALGNQSDRELGYDALMTDSAKADSAKADSTADSPARAEIKWLGEKTAQNAQVLASTLVMKVGQEDYVLTVALDNSGDAYAIRQIIFGIADHLAKVGPLVQR